MMSSTSDGSFHMISCRDAAAERLEETQRGLEKTQRGPEEPDAEQLSLEETS